MLCSKSVADLWITSQEAKQGIKKRVIFNGKTIEFHVPAGLTEGTILRLPRVEKPLIPLLKAKDAHVTIHVLNEPIYRPDSNPYGDDDLNQIVECLIPYIMVLEQIQVQQLYEEYEKSLSLEKYSHAIFSHLKRCTKRADSLAMCQVKFANFEEDAPGHIVHKKTTAMRGSSVVRTVEGSWIEVMPKYRYHTRVLGAILAHELMHHIAHESGLETMRMPEIRVGRSFKKQPTPEVLVDIASILAGAGNLYLNAVSVDPDGMVKILGYIDQGTIAKAIWIANDLLHGAGVRRIEERRLERAKRIFEAELEGDPAARRCRRCGHLMVQADTNRWGCMKCGAIVETT